MGDKIQRRGIAPINNKNNKDISIIFVTQHQLSIIVKHNQKKSFIKKWHNTFTKKPTSSLQWILKQLSKCLLKGFIRRLRSYGMLFHAGLYISSSPRAVATGRHTEKPNLPKIIRQKALMTIEFKYSSYPQEIIFVFWSAKKERIEEKNVPSSQDLA